MKKVISFPTPVPAERGDAVCQEADGCPIEKAVLQRFWREHHQTARSTAPTTGSAPDGFALVPVRMTADMINAWSGGLTVSSDEVAYRTTFQAAWKRVIEATPASPAASAPHPDEVMQLGLKCMGHWNSETREFSRQLIALLAASMGGDASTTTNSKE